jgi:hypothetical protein
VLHWKKGEKEPWLLATNFSGSREALLAYKKRMWIEEMFADFKGHGFDLQSTRLRRFGRLSRLTLAVAMLSTYGWWCTEHKWSSEARGVWWTDRIDAITACFGWVTTCWIDVWPKESGRSSAYFRALYQNCLVARCDLEDDTIAG